MSLLYTSTCFEHNCAHHQEVKTVSHSIWHHHTLQAAVRCTGWERIAVLMQYEGQQRLPLKGLCMELLTNFLSVKGNKVMFLHM